MSLDAIPIHILPSAEPGLSGNAPPLLRELAEQVKHLLATGESSAIDLSALPLTPADLDWLREKLGTGEISVTLQANGESTLNETACPGVWWVTHHNEQGAVTSQLIEVALVPELVKAHPQDVQIGYEYLELMISDL
ncbi:MAG: hydrogenase expression/formation protein [Thiobacillus sp.]|nr:hydrogenase expression/formation protein [Thiobacillus sp.]